ncbi:hypothetical protein SEA_YUMA_115 [Microbacterium phage Yuma]|nr:hypothetical protein SEA_YUMA_115 [Microbacterium phage Yuma]
MSPRLPLRLPSVARVGVFGVLGGGGEVNHG